jgi:lysozyme
MSIISTIKGICHTEPVDTQLETKLIEHEGIKRFAYQDTVGKLTIGIGRNIDDKGGKGLSTDECWYLLRNDIRDCRNELKDYDWYKGLDKVRSDAIVELCFNLGISGLLEFKDMLNALLLKQYTAAGSALKSSKWYGQVGKTRGDDLVFRIRNGQYL